MFCLPTTMANHSYTFRICFSALGQHLSSALRQAGAYERTTPSPPLLPCTLSVPGFNIVYMTLMPLSMALILHLSLTSLAAVWLAYAVPLCCNSLAAADVSSHVVPTRDEQSPVDGTF